jgi:hypothetical protein
MLEAPHTQETSRLSIHGTQQGTDHAHTYTHRHAHVHVYTQTQAPTCTHRHRHTHAHALTYAHTHALFHLLPGINPPVSQLEDNDVPSAAGGPGYGQPGKGGPPRASLSRDAQVRGVCLCVCVCERGRGVRMYANQARGAY